MRRLFKEVFRSLAYNKITLICLTILIFITSGIFTLLFDVKKSYSNTIKSYDKISKLHDLTVDIDANLSGAIPNDGFDLIGSNSKDKVNEPVKFRASKATDKVKYSIYLPKVDTEYIQLKDKFENLAVHDANLFIKAEDFLNFYNTSLIETSNVYFEIAKEEGKQDKLKIRNFKTSEPWKFQLFVKDGETFKAKIEKIDAKVADTFNFKEVLTLDELGEIVAKNDGLTKDYIKDPRSLYLNLKTKKASFLLSDYEEWKQKGELFIVNGQNLMKLLGFEKDASSDKYFFKKENQPTCDIKLDATFKSTNEKIDPSDKLKSSFNLTNFLLTNVVSSNSITFQELELNKEYKIPENWVKKDEVFTTYDWYRYRLNWNEKEDENYSNWKGLNLKFIIQFKKKYPEEYKKIKYFSYWTKSQTSTFTVGSKEPFVKKENLPFTREDLDVIFEEGWDGGEVDPVNPSAPFTKPTSPLHSVRQIELPGTLAHSIVTDEEFDRITNSKNLQNKQFFIRDNATKYAKNVIINELIKEVGEENLGIRQTMTVETVNDKTASKNVFHFINTGDIDYRIRGVKQNVGKLYDEQFSPSRLNESITNENVEKFLLKPNPASPYIQKIPPIYTKNILDLIFKGYTPDYEFFAPDTRFEDYYDFYPNTQIPVKRNGKLLIITTDSDELKTHGATEVAAIARVEENKYIFLVKGQIDGFGSQTVWKKVVSGTKNGFFTLDEMYQKLVNEGLTIKGKIGKEGWVSVNDKFRNLMTLPIGFGAIVNEYTNDIMQNKSIRLLTEAIKKILIESDLSKFLRKDDIILLTEAARKSIEQNDYHKLLAIAKSNYYVTIKVVIDIIKYLIEGFDSSTKSTEFISKNANSFIHGLFGNVIDYFKRIYVGAGVEGKVASKEERDNYLLSQIDIITKLLKLDQITILPQINLTLSDLLKYIENKEQIFDYLKNLIASIDFIKFSRSMDNWYKHHPLIPFTATDLTYWGLSTDRIVIEVIKSVNEVKFKKALKSILSTISFNKILNPDLENSFFDKLKKANEQRGMPYSKADEEEIKSVFKKINGSKDPLNPYSNVLSGISKIIDTFSVERFAESLDKLIKHVKKPITANKKVYKDFNTETLESQDWLTSAIIALSTSSDANVSGKIANIHYGLIEALNLSNKTLKSLSSLDISIPAKDDEKLSLFDLFTLAKLNIPSGPEDKNFDPLNVPIDAFSLEDIEKVKTKVKNSIESKSQFIPTLNELNFLKFKVLTSSGDLQNLEKILTKLEAYEKMVKNLQIVNLKPDVDNEGTWNWDFKFNGKELLTFGDLAYKAALIDQNNNDNPDAKNLLTTIHSILSKQLYARMLGSSQEKFIKQELGLYAPWIKLGYELFNLADFTESIITNPSTGENEIIRKKTRKLTLAQVSFILEELYKTANKKEISDLLSNYSKVENSFPDFGIIGSSGTYHSSILKIAYAHAKSSLANRLFKNALTNSTSFKDLYQALKDKGLSDEIVEDFKKILDKHQNELTYSFGYLASCDQVPTFYKDSIEKFVNSFINKDINSDFTPLVSNETDFDLLYNLTLESVQTTDKLSIINVPRSALNPLVSATFPQILMYYLLSNKTGEGNLSFIVKKLFDNLKGMTLEEVKTEINPLYDKYVFPSTEIGTGGDSPVTIDISLIHNLINNVLSDNGADITLFGINLTKAFKETVWKILQPVMIYNSIAYSDTGSYLAKVNHGHLAKNGKEIYKGDISDALSSPIKMENFLKSLDEKYKIRINSIEYLIIGEETTADYLYAVVNEQNIQVDTKTQAIVYVNQKGFDRIYSAYPTFAIKEYVLVKAPRKGKKFVEGKTPIELQRKFNKAISQITGSNFQKVYLKDETDFLNPERAIRVKTVTSVIDAISATTLYSVLILLILVGFIVYFIIKRYIGARHKVIGILRAQGYKVSEIAISFCAFGWIPTIVGTLFGYIVGFSLQRQFMQLFSSYWTLKTATLSFNFLSFAITLFIPFIAISLLIFLITFISVKRKPTEMMSGLVEVNVGKVAQRISKSFRNWGVKMRFIMSMALNNFWKMISVFLGFSTTSLLSMFFLSSSNVFSKSISRTYENRNYRYKLDLITPSTEGGPLVTYDKNNLSNLLYLPNDLAGNTSKNGSQLDYDNPNFLRPGANFNTDVILNKYDPVVLTKSSLDLLLDLSVELSPWDITYANLPETQKARVVEIFKQVSRKIENTQNIIRNEDGSPYSAVKDIKKYYEDKAKGLPEDLSNRTSFFAIYTDEHYDVGNSFSIKNQFKFVEWDPINEAYAKPVKVTTSSHRQEYRNFLIESYKKIDQPDFFVSFSGIYWNENTNEKYSYAIAKIDGKEQKIYGYHLNSKYISFTDEKKNNLTQLLANYNWKLGDDVPILVNKVTAKSLNLKLGSILQGEIKNHVDRFSWQSLNLEKPNFNHRFKVVGISATYINNEFATRKDIIDKILGFDTLTKRLEDSRKVELNNMLARFPNDAEEIKAKFHQKYEAFNGILSQDETPVQTIDTLTTYSNLGFWGAQNSYNVAGASDESIWDFFRKIFISNPSLKYTSVYEHIVTSYNEAHGTNFTYREKIKEFLNNILDESNKKDKKKEPFIDDAKFDEIVEAKEKTGYEKLARSALEKMFGDVNESIYGKDIMFGASFDVNSKDIEVGFISGMSKTITTLLTAFILISFIISIIILIVITNIMIASNQRAIAIFSVLGYTRGEKILLFFFNFIPTILLACLLMIPITFGLIAIFNAFVMTTSQIILPLTLQMSSIILSATMCLSVFTISSIATWLSLNKAKPIETLKGK
ncbi:ABC-type antimicrobial peptide transport system permease subunit [Metamycoplasma subdolum]|uniref:ABC-type antimicrobial peptide transport system permease subunit n=1 Tax=Metamycoplasma subdolum TaxID=92407 RepID=A0A3M0AIY6_9BACT|nr:ABC transporter permease [Metamycoplasma subdolum]RMA79072.1 ABC-type antimicrobial peptide transport system permease subunit [Metamycoplasma subdolum]WPB50595.1 ABC transporter permease [Metamycoplasma subdolum]